LKECFKYVSITKLFETHWDTLAAK